MEVELVALVEVRGKVVTVLFTLAELPWNVTNHALLPGRNTGSVVVTRQSRQIDRSAYFHLAVPHEDRSCGNVPEAGSSGDCAPRAARAAGASEPVGAGMAAAKPRAMGC